MNPETLNRSVPPKPGDLLVSPPELRDPNFQRSVVLLCEHSDAGSFGLVLNKPSNLQMRDMPLEFLSNAALSYGGPVLPTTLHFLHSHESLTPESIPVAGQLRRGGDFDLIRELVELEMVGPEDVRFFLGYSGWAPEQLQDEIQQGGWLVVRGLHKLALAPDPAGLWRTVLTLMGGDYALLVNYPDDIRLN